MNTCQHCNEPLVAKRPGVRPPTMFCSTTCKEKARSSFQKQERLEIKEGRTCENCNIAIPSTKHGKARFCSDKCSDAFFNGLKALNLYETKRAEPKKCARCGTSIPASHKSNSLYCSYRCKHRTMGDRQRDKYPGYQRLKRYGLTLDQYKNMLETQDHKCAICKTDEPDGKGSWHVDHDHITGQIRGLLCHSCNIGIGNLKDDPDILRAGLEYLSKT